MEVMMMESPAFQKIMQRLDFIEQAVRKQQPASEDWISTEEAKMLLGVKSKSHMQKLRDTNAIRFSQHGRKIIKYSKASILAYLKKNIPTF